VLTLETKLQVNLCPIQPPLANEREAYKPKRSVKTKTTQVKHVLAYPRYENNDHVCRNPYKMLPNNEKGLITGKKYNLRPLKLQLWTPATQKHRIITTPLWRVPTTRLLETLS
jgi:hypothetical protein